MEVEEAEEVPRATATAATLLPLVSAIFYRNSQPRYLLLFCLFGFFFSIM